VLRVEGAHVRELDAFGAAADQPLEHVVADLHRQRAQRTVVHGDRQPADGGVVVHDLDGGARRRLHDAIP
jgi:hypothetical protein